MFKIQKLFVILDFDIVIYLLFVILDFEFFKHSFINFGSVALYIMHYAR